MTNFEKWKDELIDLIGETIALKDGTPVACYEISCDDCTLLDGDCNTKVKEWLLAEYKEPAPKLTKREREFLECFELPEYWRITRGDLERLLFISSKEATIQRISSDLFPFIKPGESWSFKDLLKLEVEE